MKWIQNFFLPLLLASCALSRPLSGPGFNSDLDQVRGDPNRKVVIAITNALLDRSKRGPFDEKTQSLYKTLDKYEGYIAGSIRLRLLGKEVWTYSIWESKKALNEFVTSREHLDTMFSTDMAIEKIRSMSLEMTAKEVPLTWKEVEALIQQKPMQTYTPL